MGAFLIIAILMIPTGIVVHKARIFERIEKSMEGSSEWKIQMAKRFAAIGIFVVFFLLLAVAVGLAETSGRH